jgi:hypothetical protein
VQLESTSLILIILALVAPLAQLRSIPLLLAPQVAPHVPLANMVPQQEQPLVLLVELVSIVLQLVRVLALVALQQSMRQLLVVVPVLPVLLVNMVLQQEQLLVQLVPLVSIVLQLVLALVLLALQQSMRRPPDQSAVFHALLVNMVPQQEQPPAQRVWLESIVLQLVRVLALVALLVIMHLPRALPLARSVL